MPQNDKQAELQRDFKSFYNANLRRKYEQLEPERQKYVKKFKKSLLIFVILAVAIIILCVTGIIPEGIYSSNVFLWICTVMAFFAAYVYSIPFAQYRAATKSLIMKQILSFWGKFSYSSHSNSKINVTDLRKSGLFQDFNGNTTDDSFQGLYNNAEICVAEKELFVKEEKGERSIFEGIVILLGFSKKFKGKTVVKHKGFLFPLKSFLKRCNRFNFFTVLMIFVCSFIFTMFSPLIFFGISEYTFLTPFLFIGTIILIAVAILYLRNKDATLDVVLEDIAFNKKWHVTTNNQVEARYILTPILMEKLNDVKKLFHGKYVDFGFFDNKLLIAVHTRKNMFETTSLFTPALDYQKVSEVVNQLYSVFSIIDILNTHAAAAISHPKKGTETHDATEL